MYETPELEIIEVATDVITDSGDTDTDPTAP